MRVLISTRDPGYTEIGMRQLALMADAISIEPTVLTIIRHEDDQPYADKVLSHAAELLDPIFGTVHYKTRIGQAWEEIVAEAESGDYELLILGQRPSRSLLTRIRGEVTQKVMAETTLPLLIAKREARPIRRILICDSGVRSPSLLQLFNDRLPEILKSVTEISILHVMSQISAAPGIRGTQLRASAQELIAEGAPEGLILEEDLAFLAQMNLRPNAIVRHGLVIDEIVTEARGDQYDLVVIGGHREEPELPRFLLDDLARELIEEVKRSILVVR